MVHFSGVTKSYRASGGQVNAVRDLNLNISAGEFVSVHGPSGCGKSTMLMAAGGMLRPSTGKVIINGQDLYAMGSRARARFRAKHIGFIFQMFHLVPYLSVLDNVLLGYRADASHGRRAVLRQFHCLRPPRDTGRRPANPHKTEQVTHKAGELLKRLRLSHRAKHKPSQLSAGECQRTAIARALINNPSLILADEPTGNLDDENEVEVFEILRDYHQQGGTVVVVSHGTVANEYATHRIRMRDGRIEQEAFLNER